MGGSHRNRIYGVNELRCKLQAKEQFLNELAGFLSIEPYLLEIVWELSDCPKVSATMISFGINAQKAPEERIRSINTVSQLQQLIQDFPSTRVEVDVGDCTPCAIACTTIDPSCLQPTDGNKSF